MIKIGFITGARSEYGVMKHVIGMVVQDDRFSPCIIATGMHYQIKFGCTIEEIRKDGLAPIIDAPCYSENDRPKSDDFLSLFQSLCAVFDKHKFDVVYVIGDRLEAYAGALAAHFYRIPIVHFAGGQLTNGAVDNIYRYNISNLASIHLVTNIYAKERLDSCPIIEKSKVYLVGSSAIDNILKYQKSPKEAELIDPSLHRDNFVLMTFHSETVSDSVSNQIPEVMNSAIEKILSTNLKILVTYPNNDDGSEAIIEVIHKWEDNSNVIVRKNLGATLYYVAVDNCRYVIGNSSSGIIEVPYFQKYTVNIGARQSGRNAPKSVISLPNDVFEVANVIDLLSVDYKCRFSQENIYGRGQSIESIYNILLREFDNK